MAYASKYYDPVKAHEYYERTKELKGYENRYGGSRGNGTSAASGGSTSGSSSSSSNKPLTVKEQRAKATQRHNQAIQSQIANLRNSLNGMSKEDKAANREAIMDQIQALREQTKGGSTSGFNKKGQEAAAYIKEQMNKERDEMIAKANKEADEEMLDDVKRLQADIQAMRNSGRGFSRTQLMMRINKMLGEVKKAKTKSAKNTRDQYVQKYKDEIDKLRSDKSMYSYYDTKAERQRKQAEAAAKKAAKQASKSSRSSGSKSSKSSKSTKSSTGKRTFAQWYKDKYGTDYKP